MNDAGYLMSKRILVADDSLTIQKAFAMVMDGSDYVLSFAKSVDEALAATKSNGRLDLVLSDVVLGTGSGYDLCAEIKAEPSLRDVPVYILTSSQTPYDEARGRKVGADGHLAKPFESQALLDAVASAIASPARPISAVMPQFSADYDDNTARISDRELPDLDDDSYGEITIERSPVPPPATSSPWGAKPPTRPSGVRPIAAASPAPSPAAPNSPRPSLIPGARPSASMPAVRSGLTPQPSASAASVARPPMNRTMMGFPSVKPPVANKPAVPSPSAPPRLTPAAPMAVVPAHPVAATISPPLESPVTVKAPTPLPPTATPAAPAAAIARPVVPRFAPPPPAATPILAPTPSPSARPVVSPVSPTVPAKAPDIVAPPLAATVASAVDRKVAALAARGPEYEAIAKLSREIIEQVVWEVVPELAEAIIRQEIDRLASAKK